MREKMDALRDWIIDGVVGLAIVCVALCLLARDTPTLLRDWWTRLDLDGTRDRDAVRATLDTLNDDERRKDNADS